MKAILIVDDRAINLEFLASLLTYGGYRVMKALNGAQALDMVGLQQPALIISDVLMPVMDGKELVTRLNADPASAHIPVIFYTAMDGLDPQRLLAHCAAVVAVLTKPSEPLDILNAVAKALGEAQPWSPPLRLQQALEADANELAPASMSSPGNVSTLSLRLAAMLEVNIRLSAERDLQGLLDVFCRSAQNIMRAAHVAVGVHGRDQGRRSCSGGMTAIEVDAIFELSDSAMVRQRFAGGATLEMDDVAAEPQVRLLALEHPLRRPFLMLGLMRGTQLQGWLYVAGKPDGAPFNLEDREFAATLAAQLAPLYENLSLYEETRRLSRVSAVLSGINSAIVRIHDRQALFEEACRVAVNKGAFGMAWVALIDPDTQVGVLTACFGGSPLHTARFSSYLGGEGSAYPWSVAVRERRPVICNDIRTDASLLPLRGQLLEQGHRALAAFPLMLENRAVAVIVLFADEAGVFNEDELRLLNELAGDLSFGLQFIDKEEKLRYLACYDVLTGLPNSMLFHDRLTQFLHGTKHDTGLAAVIVLDLDHFSQLNDVMGRHAGDAVLAQVAQRLDASLAEPCSLARIGGDIFAIAVHGLNQAADALAILEQQIFGALDAPFVVDLQEVRISARAGLALYPDDGSDAETLFKHAEVALKKAKSANERFLYYAPRMNAAIAARLALRGELEIALERGQFEVYYQPRVDLQSGRIVSAEALIRWQHPQRGRVAPDQFIPLAEETGLIVPIGAWVIDAVCAQQVAWLAQQVRVVPVAVNLSTVQFKKGVVLQTIQEALVRHGLSTEHIEFELTESVVMNEPEQAARKLQALKQMGVKLSLDDFGTGYSSLAYLKRFPFDFVKIDRAFITDIMKSGKDAMIANAVIAMGHSLNLRVVAEGVETEEQLAYLCKHRCDEMQGYYFSPPVPAKQFAAMLREDKRLALPPLLEPREER